MAIWVPNLDWILENRTKAKAPIVLKLALGIQAFFLIAPSRPTGPLQGNGETLAYLGLWAAEAAVLLALWNMKRWPVIALGLYAVVHAAIAVPQYLAMTTR